MGGSPGCCLTVAGVLAFPVRLPHSNFRFSQLSRGASLWAPGAGASGAVRMAEYILARPRVVVSRGETTACLHEGTHPRAQAPGLHAGDLEGKFQPSAGSSLLNKDHPLHSPVLNCFGSKMGVFHMLLTCPTLCV